MHVTCFHREKAALFLKLVTLLLLLFLHISPAIAESTRLIHGLDFPVDDISQVDLNSSRVRVLGNTRIVANADIDEYVVSQYLNQPEFFYRFSTERLRSFSVHALNEERYNLASTGLRVLLAHPESSDDLLLELIAVFSERENTRPLFKELLLLADSDFSVTGTIALLYQVGLDDINWIRSNVIRLIYIYPGELKSTIKRNFTEAVKKRQSEKLEKIVKFASDTLGGEEDFTQRVRMLAAEANYIFSLLEDNKLDELDAAAFLHRQDPLYLEVLYPIVLAALYDEIEEAGSLGDNGRALFLLAKTNMERRTPKTHDLVRHNLKNLTIPEGSVLSRGRVSDMLIFLSSKDEEIRQRYVEALSKQIFEYTVNNNFHPLEGLFTNLSEVRPDPHAANDSLRLEYVVALVNAGHMRQAESILSQIHTLSLLSKARLMLLRIRHQGITLDLPLYIASLAVLLFGLLFLFQRFKTRKEPEAIEEDEEEDRGQPSGFSYIDHLKQLNPRRQEYARCLAVLGLEPGVDLHTIKSAYRSALKQAHPDTKQGKDLKASQRFMEVTKAYEDLMKLENQFHFSKQGGSES